MAFNQIATSVTIINSGLVGFLGVSLTNPTTTAVSSIASGSAVEIAGAFFKADGDITINASSWTAITTATSALLALTPSGTAGSQVLTASWIAFTSTAAVWSTSKQGYYLSAASTVRVVGGAYKIGPTSQDNKWIGRRNETVVLTATSGTYTVPPFTTAIKVYCQGGGGGGGESSGTSGAHWGGGGGAGGGCAIKSYAVTCAQTFSFTVGAGGTGGTGIVTPTSGSIASDGGDSTFGDLTGYHGHAGRSYSVGVAPSIGGSAAGGIVNCKGSDGVASSDYAGDTSAHVNGGNGGNSFFGGGGGGAGITQGSGSGNNGYPAGIGGGGGGASYGATFANGATGGSGIIVIEESC